MKTKSPYAFSLAVLLSAAICVPWDLCAAPQAAGQRAGEVSRVIPAVSIARGAKTITASPKSQVDWQDVVNTQVNARARIALDDGSVLNVGSESSLHIVKHDGAAQQTELELTYGKLRSEAQKIAKPDGKFEVKTPAGVAGVVGTDFYIAYENDMMNVAVFEGFVRVCNNAGACVMVKAGQMTNVHNGDNAAPTPPQQAPLDLLVQASNNTNTGGGSGGSQTAGASSGHAGLIWSIVAIGIPAVAIPVIITTHHSTPTNGCPVGDKAC